MTPSTLMFLYLLSCAVCWTAKWMREWEKRDLERRFTEHRLLSWEKCRYKMDILSGDLKLHISEMMYGLVHPAPQKTETVKWADVRREVLDPLKELEDDMDKAMGPVFDKILNRKKDFTIDEIILGDRVGGLFREGIEDEHLPAPIPQADGSGETAIRPHNHRRNGGNRKRGTHS